MEERFRISGPISPVALLAKGLGVEAPSARRLAGWVTTYGTIGPDGGIVPTVDRENQIMECASVMGLINWTTYLTKGVGVWNDAHSSRRVGMPESLEFHDGTTDLSRAHGKVGFWTTGSLFDRANSASWVGLPDRPSDVEFERADYYWALGNELRKGPRTLAFSVEGTMTVSSCGHRIIRACVDEAAVLEYPYNPDSTAEVLAKGLSFEFLQKGMSIEPRCSCVDCSGDSELLVKGIMSAAATPGLLGMSPGATKSVAGQIETVQQDPRFARLVQVYMKNYRLDEAKARAKLIEDIKIHLERAHAE